MLTTTLVQIFAVILIAIPLMYGSYCLLARRLLDVDWYLLLLNMASAFLIMSIMEAGLGFLHTEIFGWRLWEYHIYPNHRDYGTDLGFITWPWYGFHFYFFNRALEIRHMAAHGVFKKGSITGIDGPLLEILGNGLYLVMFGSYVFYYFPGDLWHLTSVKVMPYYAIAGIVLAIVMHALERAPRSWALPVALYFTGACYIVIG